MHGGASVGHGGGSIGVHSSGFAPSGRFGGGFRGGFNRGPVFRTGFGFRRFNNFFYPGYYGFGYYDPYWYDTSFWNSDYGYPDSYPYSGYGADYGYPAAQAPPVIINQQYAPPPPAEPVIREFVGPAPAVAPPAPQKYEEPLYLIAFKDGNIRAVAAYWVQGTTLHYVTLEHEQKQAPLSSVDRELSNRFNHERNVTFQLP